MKLKESITLGFVFGIASVLVLVLQSHLFQEPLIPSSMATGDLDNWWSNVFSPATYVVFGLGIIINLIWFIKASVSRYKHSKSALSAQGLWWLLFFIYLIVTLVVFAAFTHFAIDPDKPIKGIFEASCWAANFLILDVILLFWLPTALATPRTLRYIPPFSMSLRKLIGD